MSFTCFQVFADAEQAALAAVARLEAAAQQAIARSGRFTCVLPGGTTPGQVYAHLAQTTTDKQHWHCYLSDERVLPSNHPERNSQLLARSGLAAQVQLHPIPTEQGLAAAVTVYAAALQAALPFDCVLLGLGEDGHTASLFPDHRWPMNAAVCAVTQAPKWPPERVSLTPWALSQATQVLFLATGAGKAAAVAAWYHGTVLPAATIMPAGGVEVYVDAAAWAAATPPAAIPDQRYCRQMQSSYEGISHA